MSSLADPLLSEQRPQKAIKRTLDLPPEIPPLSELYLYIAGSCNLACQHCWITPTFDPEGKSTWFSDPENVQKAVDQALPLGLSSVKLTGGEPTLHPRFREIVSILHEAGVPFQMETNGTLINRDLAEFLVERGLAFVSVSIDGGRAETHDELRQVSGSFDQAVAGVRALVAAGIKPQLICTLHGGNVSEMSDVVKLAEDLGCGSIKFNVLQQMGRGERLARERGLSVDTILDLYNHVNAELRPISKVVIYFSIPIAFWPLNRMIAAPSKCSVLNILGMLSGGELSLCGIGVNVPELVYGHIEQDNLKDVWCNNAGLIELRKLVPSQLDGICQECIHKNFCLGNCIAHNYFSTRKVNSSFYFCEIANEMGLFPLARKSRL